MRFPILHVCWILLIPGWAWAESATIDSLKQVLAASKDRFEQAELSIALTEEYIKLDPKVARTFAQDALLSAQSLNDRLLTARAYNALGLISRYQGDHDIAQRYHSRALIELEGEEAPKELSTTHRQLGAAFHRQGKWDMAWEQYTYALQIAETHSLSLQKSRVLSNMGSIRRMQGNLEDALVYYQQALELADQDPNAPSRIRAMVINNVANIYMQEKRLTECLEAYREVKRLRIENDDSVGVVMVMFNIGTCFHKMQELDSSEHYNRLGIELASSIGLKPEVLSGYLDMLYIFLWRNQLDSAKYYGLAAQKASLQVNNRHSEADVNIALGFVYATMDQIDSALYYLNLAERQADTLGAQSMKLRAYNALRRIYAATEQYEEAYQYRHLEARLSDSIYNSSGNTLTAKLEAQQALNEQERQIERLNLQKRIQRNWWIAILIFSILLLFSLFLYVRVRAQRKINGILAEKNEAIRYQNYQLSEHNADLEQFAFAVSHNMREPLRTLGSYAGLVRKRYYDQLDEDGNSFLNFISGSAQHLHNLMADLLTYVQLGKRPIHLLNVDMNLILKKVRGQLSDSIQKRNAQVIIDELPNIQGDPDNLFLLFHHLVQNALTFQDVDAPLIEVHYRKGSDYHLFGVRDNGLGVPADQRQKIFQLFQRLNAHKSETGTGIGLSICQKVVHQHQGQIWVTENAQKGSTFWVKIPDEISPLTSP